MIKKYIGFGIDNKINAGNSSENVFFKLMNNRVYGKTIENLRKKANVRFVNEAKDYENYVRKLSLFHRRYLAKILLLFMKLNQF